MEKRFLTRFAPLALAACAILLAPAAQAQDDYLARFAGNWIGQGALRPEGQGAREAVYCRIASEVSPDGATLRQSGRCAVGDQSRRIAGTIVYDAARGTARGSWTGRKGETIDAAGRRENERLVLQLSAGGAGAPGPSTITFLPLSEGRYRMLLSGAEGGGEIEFRRQ